ncbi:MAG: hypothetical protein JW891_11800 [Candidatus Lokiarchaeota archaeon]|nr:hypothetical protein [Candidatus Lokiarchaeota archaeon]
MESNEMRLLNKQFDRRLIRSYLSSYLSNANEINSGELKNILKNLIKNRQLLLHCSNISKENLVEIYEKGVEKLSSLRDLKLVESKDNLMFLSV